MRERKRLGQILRDLQVLTNGDVDRILDAMRRRRDLTKFGHVARDMGLLGEEHILAALAVQMQMFPGIQNLSLQRLLDKLQEPIPPARPSRRRPPAGRFGRCSGFTSS
jgi:hypothetical protein